MVEAFLLLLGILVIQFRIVLIILHVLVFNGLATMVHRVFMAQVIRAFIRCVMLISGIREGRICRTSAISVQGSYVRGSLIGSKIKDLHLGTKELSLKENDPKGLRLAQLHPIEAVANPRG